MDVMAAEDLESGQIVTVICLSPSPRAHRMAFTDAGFWLQTGGVLGWSTRHGPRLRQRRISIAVAAAQAQAGGHRAAGGNRLELHHRSRRIV